MLSLHLLLLAIPFYSILLLVKNNYTEQFIDHIRTDNHRIADLISNALQQGNPQHLSHLIDSILTGGQPVSIVIKNPSGIIIYPENIPESEQAQSILKEDFFFGENFDTLYYINSSLSSDDGNYAGMLQMAFDESLTVDEINKLDRVGIIISVAYIFIVLIFIGIIDRVFTQPLRNLTNGANKISSGKLDEQFYINSNVYEVKTLSHSLEIMRNKLVNRGKQLADKEKRIRIMLNNIADAVIVCDSNGNIESANNAVNHIFGYNINRIIETNIFKIINFDELKKNINKPTSERFCEMTAFDINNNKIPVEAHINQLEHDNQSLFLILIRDIRERIKNERQRQQHYIQLNHAGRLNIMGEMATGLAHELNQPLAAISLYLQGCLRRSSSDENINHEIINAVKSADEQAKRAAGIIRRIKEFSHKENEKFDYKVEDINKLIQRSITFVLLDQKYSMLQPQLSLTQTALQVKVDSLQIEQVLVNLIRNAFEAMNDQNIKNPTLSISTDKDSQNYVEVCIADSGNGVSTENINRIFETYYTTKSDGLGMGLSICKSIIAEHNGTLFYRQGDNQGAEFCFKLPLFAS